MIGYRVRPSNKSEESRGRSKFSDSCDDRGVPRSWWRACSCRGSDRDDARTDL